MSDSAERRIAELESEVATLKDMVRQREDVIASMAGSKGMEIRADTNVRPGWWRAMSLNHLVYLDAPMQESFPLWTHTLFVHPSEKDWAQKTLTELALRMTDTKVLGRMH